MASNSHIHLLTPTLHLQVCLDNRQMNEYLSNHSVIALYVLHDQQLHFISAESLIKDRILLASDPAQRNFENALFCVQTEGSTMEFSMPIEYEQAVYLRHKVSRKYLGVAVDDEDERQIRYKIVLTTQKHHFKITSCYQYQKKISKKIKFNQEIFLRTEYAASREGDLLVQDGELLLGFNQGSKLILHFYSLQEKEERCYKHGRVVWLAHMESNNFLSVGAVNGKEEVVFEPIRYDKQIQNLKALWTIHSSNLTLSNDLKFDEELRLKNLYNGQFLTFSRNYRLVDNERIYQIFLEEAGGDSSKFALKSVKELDHREVTPLSYVSLLHAESGLFVGCRRQRAGDYFKLLTFPLMDDEDLFRINGFEAEEEQALRLIFVIRQEFKDIAATIAAASGALSAQQMRDIHQTYRNVLQELTSLRKLDALFEFVRNQLGSSIRFIAENLPWLRALAAGATERIRRQAKSTLEVSYKILQLFCTGHEGNQRICHSFVSSYMGDVGADRGAEKLLMETFRDNRELLPLIRVAPTPSSRSLVQALLQEFCSKNSDRQVWSYWQRMLELIEVLNVIMMDRGNPLDINQFLISEQIFGQGRFEQIFPPLRVQGERLLVELSEGEVMPVESIREEKVIQGVEALLGLLGNLVSSHSIPSKAYIHSYLAKHNQACLSTLISYLNRPLRKQLYSTLLNFIAHCYVDSAPRLRRHKPMSFLFFSFEEELTNVEIEEAYYSERLREMFMLRAQESRVCKPLHYSNTISIGSLNEPSISQQQLVSFRLSLTQALLNSSTCTKQQLLTVELMMRLDCYTVNEMLQLESEFKVKLMSGVVQRPLVPRLLSFFEQMFLLAQELQIKKLKIYLQTKFQQREDLTQQEYKYILPHSPRAPLPFLQPQHHHQHQEQPQHANADPIQESDLTHRSLISKDYISDYNQLRDTLELMHASQELRTTLMDLFCQPQTGEISCQYLSSLFSLLVRCYLPKWEFLRLLTRCTILTHEEVGQFDRLFDLSKKLQYLVLVSENWLVRQESPQCGRLFLQMMSEVTDFLFEDGKRIGERLQVKRQLLVGNLGVHRAVFQLLEKSAYLLKVSKKELKKKHKETFERCFDLIYWLIRQCSENKRLIYDYVSVLLPYLKCLEVGQTRTFTEFYRDQKEFAKEINFSVIQGLIQRIIHRPSSEHKYEECEYNPDYLNVLIVIIEALDIENKFFIERLHKLIIRPDVFHRLLFLEEGREEGRPRFCLKLHRIRLDPVQVPVVYHLSLLKLFRTIFQNCSEVIRNSLKLKLSQVLQVQYLLQVLAEPDVFSSTGIAPQLNFLLKEEAIKFLLILLEKSDAHAQLYDSTALPVLIDFYIKAFLHRGQRKEVSSESESLYLPFLQMHGEYLAAYQQNRNAYYLEHVHPLMQRITALFQRQPARSPAATRLRDRVLAGVEALKQATAGVAIKRATTLGQYGLKDIKLKWRNFVDDDQDNSREEKFAKKTVLDILKSKPAAQQIELELAHFYAAIAQRSSSYVTSTLRLLTMLFASKDISDGRKREGKVAEEALRHFSGYILQCGEQEGEAILQQLEENDFLGVLLRLTAQKEFQLSKIHLKNIFAYCLRVLNFILSRDTALRTHKTLLSRFEDRHFGGKFLQFLKQGALEVISSADSQHFHEQINAALESMSLCADEPPVRLFQQSFLTLTLLCRHQPFTDFLRSQKSQLAGINFLDKIYNMLTFLFSAKHLPTHISVSSVRAAEHILDFVCSMVTGGNKTNQNFIIDNKFTHFVHQVLKLEQLHAPTRQPLREELLSKIIEFYHSNGIEISDLLHSKIRLIDFRQPYLLNRFKHALVRTLLQCLIGNSTTETKVKLELPVEIVKINLLWVYQMHQQYGAEYRQEFILHPRDDWQAIVERMEEQKARKEDEEVLKDDLFLRLGFYYYQIIECFEKDEEGELGQSEERVATLEKEKERIVRKFFLTIRDSNRNEESEHLLADELLSQQMRVFYHSYYNALEFFRKKTSTIQVSLKGKLLRVYFPRLPLAQGITENMRKEFQQRAVRISRGQKIKSLLQWEQNFYEDLKGEDDFFSEFQHSMPLLGSALRVMKHQSEFLLVAWLFSLLICLAYLIENMQEPSFEFARQFFSYISIASDKPMHTLMLLLSIANLFIGLLIGFFLISRKIPLRKRLLELKLAKLRLQGQQVNEFTFVWGSIFRQTIYNIYMVVFLCLTIVHPFFSAFPLVQAISRIEMGRFIMRSLSQTWLQLFVTVGLLVVFNVLYVQLAYESFTNAPVYGPICTYQYRCMLAFNDQNLKAGQGIFGVVTSDYNNMVLNMQVIYQIMYIILSLKVIFEIFSGTIIDKFSQLREQEEAIEDDQTKICFICGMERFDLDLQYQGFQEHTSHNHNHLHYIEYLFYLRRCQPQEYGIVERYVANCTKHESEEWIPELNSVVKQEKEREAQKEQKIDVKDRHSTFCKKKIQEMKKMHQKVEVIIKDLGGDDRMHKHASEKINE